MNERDKQAIDDLFQHLYQTATQGGPRDPEAEARIKQLFEKGPPGLLYHMAQTLVGQRYALDQMRAQLAAERQRQQGGRPAGFAPPWARGGGRPGYGGYGPPPYQQPYQPGWQQPARSGFLAGAGQIALGVGGGILAAEALSDLFSGDPLFGGDRDDYGDRGDDGNYGDGGDYGDRGDGGNYGDDGNYGDGGFDDGGFDSGGFDSGGFDGDQGGW